MNANAEGLRKSNERLIHGGIWALIARYAFPSVASMVGVSLYILADTYFIANGVGELGLAALNIALPIYALIGSIGNMVGIGGATLFSISRETGNRRAYRDVFTLCLVTVLAVSGIFVLAGLFLSRGIAVALGASSDTVGYAQTYIRVLLIFAPAFVVNNVVTAFVRNDGNPNLAMFAMLSAVAFNTVFDYVFIYIFGWGMFGAILATVLAPLVGLLILRTHFRSGQNRFAIRRIRPRLDMLFRVLRGGAATFVMELAYGVVVLGFNYKLLEMIGDLGVAAFGVISNLAYVLIAIFNGLGQGVQPIVSANYGADRLDRCRTVFRNGSIVAFLVSVLLVGIIVAFRVDIAGAFNREDNAAFAQIAEQGLILYFISFLFCGVNILVISYQQAMLSSLSAISISLTRGLFGVLLGLAVLPDLFGASGIWLTAPFAEVLATLLIVGQFVLEKRLGTVGVCSE